MSDRTATITLSAEEFEWLRDWIVNHPIRVDQNNWGEWDSLEELEDKVAYLTKARDQRARLEALSGQPGPITITEPIEDLLQGAEDLLSFAVDSLEEYESKQDVWNTPGHAREREEFRRMAACARRLFEQLGRKVPA